MMKIIKRIDEPKDLQGETLHLQEERKDRIDTYYNDLGRGDFVSAYIVDKGHENGLEIHVLRSSRLIEIYNNRTRRLITVLYARDNQLKRYFKEAPMHLFEQFTEGYNYI